MGKPKAGRELEREQMWREARVLYETRPDYTLTDILNIVFDRAVDLDRWPGPMPSRQALDQKARKGGWKRARPMSAKEIALKSVGLANQLEKLIEPISQGGSDNVHSVKLHNLPLCNENNELGKSDNGSTIMGGPIETDVTHLQPDNSPSEPASQPPGWTLNDRLTARSAGQQAGADAGGSTPEIESDPPHPRKSAPPESVGHPSRPGTQSEDLVKFRPGLTVPATLASADEVEIADRALVIAKHRMEIRAKYAELQARLLSMMEEAEDREDWKTALVAAQGIESAIRSLERTHGLERKAWNLDGEEKRAKVARGAFRFSTTLGDGTTVTAEGGVEVPE